MKKLRVLKNILVRTKAHRIMIPYFVFVMISALLILIIEPDITRYWDAVWYCYAVISTAGFGDIQVHMVASQIISFLVTAYSTIVIAIVTGVVVNYYTEITEIQRKETLAAFVDKLERLDTMSKEELKEMSQQVKNFKKNVFK